MASHTTRSLAIMPSTTHCPCFSLHAKCNPYTCFKSANREETAEESFLIESTVSVECTLSALRISGLQGCFTCGIYYAGLSIPGHFSHKADENNVRVKIKDNGAHVTVCNADSDDVYDSFEFFTTKESGEFMH